MKYTTISNFSKLLTISLVGSTLLAQPAMAIMPDTSVFRDSADIPDATLAVMRGRYAGPSGILYFGVEMVTQWQTADGRILNSGISLSVDKQYRPTITIVTQNTAPTSGAASQTSTGHGNVVISGGLGNVSGVAQSIQIGGDGNAIHNDLNMNIQLNATDKNANPPPENGIALNGPGTTAINDNGSTTTVTLSGNTLSMAVGVAGQGQVLQQLRGSAGFLQSAQIGGDLNQIHNVININAGLSGGGAGALSGNNFQSAMDSLRGIRTMGAF